MLRRHKRGKPVPDRYNLQRFLDAQDPVFEQVLAELRAGCKVGHWMWFVFPQLRGLGSSSMAQHFGISSLPEAAAYLQHTVLGPRLTACTQLVIDAKSASIRSILGHPDDLKFRSCMSLFLHAGSDNRVFRQALDQYFAAAPDSLTLERLRATFL
jgi:uncharacterized protein (DUF1810 family)